MSKISVPTICIKKDTCTKTVNKISSMSKPYEHKDWT